MITRAFLWIRRCFETSLNKGHFVKVITKIHDMVEACNTIPRPLGLVPTMGALHRGHEALFRQARQNNASVAVSIFVNPVQFSSQADFQAYPRDQVKDLEFLSKSGVDLVFCPMGLEMFPSDMESRVNVGAIGGRIEGKFRPGHFEGVATVVCKLFNVTRADKVYFGQKDAQQNLVIKRTIFDLNYAIEMVVVPTVREKNGLACSSRNSSLTPIQRKKAGVIYEALLAVKKLFESGETDVGKLRNEAKRVLVSEPVISSLDYVSIADSGTLEELKIINRSALMSIALWIGETRLIDNLVLSQ